MKLSTRQSADRAEYLELLKSIAAKKEADARANQVFAAARAKKRRLARWKSGTCQMNQAWYLRRCLQHGHDPKPTVWSDHLPR